MEGNTNYFCGIENEKKVARKLKRMGATDVKISPGSRGAADITAKFSTGRKLVVQVKSTCEENGKVKSLSKKEKDRLAKSAKENKATAVVAKVKNRKIDLTYLISGRDVI